MQKYLSSLALIALMAILFSGCVSDTCQSTQTYQVYEPVYLKAEEFRIPISAEPPRTICATGQLYYYQDFLLIAEPQEGIHIIDNDDASAPQGVAFLPVPGVENMAIRNDKLYVNSYVDLLVFDFSVPSAPNLLNRKEDVFPYYGWEDPELGYLVAYEPREEQVVVDCDQPIWGNCFDCVFVDVLTANAFSANESLDASLADNRSTGIGGSLARFTMAQGHMYVVDEHSLQVFDLSQATDPTLVNTISLGWGIETIFPYGDKLFIGSRTGMHIYDNVNPSAPEMLSIFEHANACDPVFVDGDIAYVTLRDGNECQNFINQLEVVDISDLRNPVLLKTYPMHRPIGLSVLDNHLYLCDDDEGLKVFDVSSWQDIDQRQVAHLRGFTTRDVITLATQKQAIVVGESGLWQLDISDPTAINELSLLPACN